MTQATRSIQEDLGGLVIPMLAIDRIDTETGQTVCPANEDAGLTLEDAFWRAFERSSL